MKTVKVTIVGTLLVVDYCSKSRINEEEGFNDLYYFDACWDELDALYVDGNEEENLIKKKGKYVKDNTYWHDLLSEDGDHPLPVEMHTRHFQPVEADYNIGLADDEEFDIKKVQLVKSLEFDTFDIPYYICAMFILYDGKKVMTYDFDDYCPEEKCYNEFEIDELYDRPY